MNAFTDIKTGVSELASSMSNLETEVAVLNEKAKRMEDVRVRLRALEMKAGNGANNQ